MKQCTKCRLYKEQTAFYSWVTRTGVVKYQSWCKSCMKQHQTSSRIKTEGKRTRRSKYVTDVDGATEFVQQPEAYYIPRRYRPYVSELHPPRTCLFFECRLPALPPETLVLPDKIVLIWLCATHWIRVERAESYKLAELK